MSLVLAGQPAGRGSSGVWSAVLRARSWRSHSMPLSSTATTTSGRPVLTVQAPTMFMPATTPAAGPEATVPW